MCSSVCGLVFWSTSSPAAMSFSLCCWWYGSELSSLWWCAASAAHGCYSGCIISRKKQWMYCNDTISWRSISPRPGRCLIWIQYLARSPLLLSSSSEKSSFQFSPVHLSRSYAGLSVHMHQDRAAQCLAISTPSSSEMLRLHSFISVATAALSSIGCQCSSKRWSYFRSDEAAARAQQKKKKV
jgi:hypothetical protein